MEAHDAAAAVENKGKGNDKNKTDGKIKKCFACGGALGRMTKKTLGTPKPIRKVIIRAREIRIMQISELPASHLQRVARVIRYRRLEIQMGRLYVSTTYSASVHEILAPSVMKS